MTSQRSVTARIRLKDGTTIANIAPAWVIVAPPDFAPEIQGVVTLYDIMLQVGIDKLGVKPPTQVSFTNHVFPLLQRTRQLRWVNGTPNWTKISDDWPALADASPAASQLRGSNAEFVRNIESVLSSYKLTTLQQSFLDAWVAGNFLSDWVCVPEPGNKITAGGLTRAALDSTVGQGFFPGIEGGIWQRIPRTPIRFSSGSRPSETGDRRPSWRCVAGRLQGLQELVAVATSDDVRPNQMRRRRFAGNGEPIATLAFSNFSRLGFITAQKGCQEIL